MWQDLGRRLASLIPGACLLCGAAASGPGLCRGCLDDLPAWPLRCHRCGLALAVPGECGLCLNSPPPWDRLETAFDYRFPVDRLIHRLKYHQDLVVTDALTPVLCRRIRQSRAALPQALLPVPLHRSRLRQRGYNQAQEIARFLARELGPAIADDLVLRQRKTREQTSLDRRARRRNLRQAFRLTRPSPWQSIAIVDDVVTSGATAGALAGLLRRAGAKEIQVWCLARASLS